MLLSLYEKHGMKWALIARQIPGRTDDACSKRYQEALNPSLKRGEWDAEEDEKLIHLSGIMPRKWVEIGHELNRPSLACRNRWRMFDRKNSKANRPPVEHFVPQSAPPPAQLPQPESEPPFVTNQWDLNTPLLELPHYYQWDPETSQFSSIDFEMSQYQLPDSQVTEFGSPHYVPADLHETQDSLHLLSTTPPPFRFSSSSLSAALSCPSITSSSQSPTQNPPTTLPPENSLPPAASGPPPPSTSYLDSPENSSTISIASSPFSRDTTASTSTSPDINTHVPLEPIHSNISSPCVTSGSLSPSTKPQLLQALLSLPTPPFQSQQQAHTYAHSLHSDSSPRHYRTAAERLAQTPINKRRPDRPGEQRRLCATLPATSDPSVRAYACGHPDCWPDNAPMSKHCFNVSLELSDHWKLAHGDPTQVKVDKPFRCALAGCGKCWKSVNGLQYHLQVSKAHFQQAIVSTLMQSGEKGGMVLEGSSTTEPKRKIYPCTHPRCPNVYKQLSGLRYHLHHGHPKGEELPTQLDVVPPVLAQKVAKKRKRAAISDE